MSEFPAHWDFKTIGDFASRVRTKNTGGECQDPMTISAIDGLVSQRDYFNKIVASRNTEGYTLLHKNDFAYNKSYSDGYPVGAARRLKTKDRGIVSPLYICFELDREQIDLQFADYLFDSDWFVQAIYGIAKEGARSHGLLNIGIEEFFSASLPIPPLPEQKKIAEILSGIDKTLERTKRRTTTLVALEVATRNELFENLAKDSHSERRLSEIVLAPITYGIVQPGDYDPNGIILVRGQDYLQGWGKKEFFKVSPGLSDRYKRSLIKPKDVLICIAGANTGDSSITPKWISNANITQTTARVRADTDIISPEFLLEFTKSRVGRERLMNYVKGSAQPGLNLSDIEKVVIPIPGNDQQQRISNSMDSLKKLVLSSRTKEDYLNQIKKGLSSDLLSGRKRVSI